MTVCTELCAGRLEVRGWKQGRRREGCREWLQDGIGQSVAHMRKPALVVRKAGKILSRNMRQILRSDQADSAQERWPRKAFLVAHEAPAFNAISKKYLNSQISSWNARCA